MTRGVAISWFRGCLLQGKGLPGETRRHTGNKEARHESHDASQLPCPCPTLPCPAALPCEPKNVILRWVQRNELGEQPINGRERPDGALVESIVYKQCRGWDSWVGQTVKVQKMHVFCFCTRLNKIERGGGDVSEKRIDKRGSAGGRERSDHTRSSKPRPKEWFLGKLGEQLARGGGRGFFGDIARLGLQQKSTYSVHFLTR